MITIAYEEKNGLLYRLLFAGLNEQGKPQWVSLTPGEAKCNESPWMEAHNENFYHLCKEGDVVSSRMIARIIGLQMEIDYEVDFVKSMSRAVDQLEMLKVKWDKEPLNLTVTIFDEAGDKEDEKEWNYNLYIECDMKQTTTLASDVYFKSLHDVSKALTFYRMYLNYMRIPVTQETIRSKKRILTQWKRRYDNGFTRYVDIDQEL